METESVLPLTRGASHYCEGQHQTGHRDSINRGICLEMVSDGFFVDFKAVSVALCSVSCPLHNTNYLDFFLCGVSLCMTWQNCGSLQSEFLEHMCILIREKSVLSLVTAIKT